jgi:hypothetical protein
VAPLFFVSVAAKGVERQSKKADEEVDSRQFTVESGQEAKEVDGCAFAAVASLVKGVLGELGKLDKRFGVESEKKGTEERSSKEGRKEGYTSHGDEKSAQGIENRGVEVCPLGKRVRKCLEIKELNRNVRSGGDTGSAEGVERVPAKSARSKGSRGRER